LRIFSDRERWVLERAFEIGSSGIADEATKGE